MSAPEFERALQDRRAEAVVHRQQRTAAFRHCGNRGDVGNFGERIGRRLQKEQLCIRAHRRLPFGHIGGGNVSRLDAEFLDDVVEQVDRRAEDAARGDDVVAALQQPHHARQDRRHAGSHRDALFRAFQRGEPLLEHRHGRIGEARIDVARLLADEARGGLCGALVHEARCQEQRLAVLAELAAHRPGAHRQSFRLVFFTHFYLFPDS